MPRTLADLELTFLALKSMGADFLNSYTKMVDGEKDPRNLMLLFAMDRVILLEFEIGSMVEVSSIQPLRSQIDQSGLVRHYILLLSYILPTTAK